MDGIGEIKIGVITCYNDLGLQIDYYFQSLEVMYSWLCRQGHKVLQHLEK